MPKTHIGTPLVASKAQSYYSVKQAKRESGGMLPQESIGTATF